MIKGLHAILFTPHADEVRTFIRDKLQFPHTDIGGGWLIFDMAAADLASHPSDTTNHQISFYCDDIHATVAELKGRGVEFTSGISEQEWGWLTTFRVTSDIELQLYQPKYSKSA
jgi:predicted enzyme related to lactoylglutathione lyase